MGMTFTEISTNATQTANILETTGGVPNIDLVTYDYDLTAAPLVLSARLISAGLPGEVEFTGLILSGSNTAGSFTVASSVTPVSVFQQANGYFTYNLTLAEWNAAGAPGAVQLVFTDDIANEDTEDAIIFNLTCFARDTLIATPDGAVPVQDLKIGDLVMTPDGDVPVKWIGRRSDYTVFSGPDIQPVRIRAGALGPGVPRRDLQVTADHGMLVDGLIVTAGALINGDTIDVVPLDEMAGYMTYYHIETEAHAVIWAEGAPAETYIDYVGRQAFDNYAEYVALYGEDRAIREMAYPRITSARMVPTTLLTQGQVARIS